MKQLSSLCLVALGLGIGMPGARAQQSYSYPNGAGPYCRLNLGPSLFEDGRLTRFGGPVNNETEYDVGFAASAAFGYAFNHYIATDLEIGGIGAEIRSVEGFGVNDTFLNNVPFLANATFSFPIPRTIVVPYIGGGAGGSLTVFNTDGLGNGSVAVFGDDTDLVFAWQAFAGLRFNLNEHTSLGFCYKYFATEDSSFSYPPAFPGSGPNLSLGFEGIKAHSFLFTFEVKF